MYYCEKCNFASADDVCKVCGKGNLRKINGDDFCYFTSLLAFDYEMYESALKSKKILMWLECHTILTQFHSLLQEGRRAGEFTLGIKIFLRQARLLI